MLGVPELAGAVGAAVGGGFQGGGDGDVLALAAFVTAQRELKHEEPGQVLQAQAGAVKNGAAAKRALQLGVGGVLCRRRGHRLRINKIRGECEGSRERCPGRHIKTGRGRRFWPKPLHC